MLQLQKDGTLIRTCGDKDETGRIRETIELPFDLLDRQANLLDRVFAFAFDVLDLKAVELRIRPPTAQALLECPANADTECSSFGK
jgi:hypothetical protein